MTEPNNISNDRKIIVPYRPETQETGAAGEKSAKGNIWGANLIPDYNFGISFSNKKELPAEKSKKLNLEFSFLKQTWGEFYPEISDEFIVKTMDIAKELNCDAEDLLAIFSYESKMEPAAGTGFGGICQLSEASLKNTIKFSKEKFKENSKLDENVDSLEKFRKLTREEQLDYAKDYILLCKEGAGLKNDRKLSAGELYGLFFLPGRVKNGVLCNSTDIMPQFYKSAKHFDLNNDNSITTDDLKQCIEAEKEMCYKKTIK
ncbi:TPA: hypothetical protein IAD52_01040 [Candidatus Spyradomonas excrementavium]|nr:hypothetical protein [Candidatus Spyradomonas excrementavium]